MEIFSVDKIETEFDDVVAIVGTGPDDELHWKVSRDWESESPRFNIDYFDIERKQWMRTIYSLGNLEFISAKSFYYYFIRSEQEYFLWCLKYGR